MCRRLPVSPTSRIRPSATNFSLRKVLIYSESRLQKFQKVAVVQTYPVPNATAVCIIACRYVSALQHSQKKWQGAPLLEHRREQAMCGKSDRPAACALPWRDHRPATKCLAKGH